MRPSDSTTGVNIRLTPNFLKSICGRTGGRIDVATYGNSPPTRKFAVSPETAVKFGSASVRITPACSIARTVALMRGDSAPVMGSVVMPCCPDVAVLLSG